MKAVHRCWFDSKKDWNQDLWDECMNKARNEIEYIPQYADEVYEARMKRAQQLYDETKTQVYA